MISVYVGFFPLTDRGRKVVHQITGNRRNGSHPDDKARDDDTNGG